MSDSIKIKGIAAVGFHGVYTEERAKGQKFIVDVKLSLPLQGMKDDLSKTVNYADVAHLVVRHITGEPVNLIETVAESIADEILKDFPLVNKAQVKVHKPEAPINLEFADVVVEIEKER
jgi:7,8-dihydroneopterin aldolase/epimerase/oxygenase